MAFEFLNLYKELKSTEFGSWFLVDLCLNVLWSLFVYIDEVGDFSNYVIFINNTCEITSEMEEKHRTVCVAARGGGSLIKCKPVFSPDAR